MFRPKFKTPHPSAKGMVFGPLSKRVVIRHGANKFSLPARPGAIEVNSLDSIRANANKMTMKQILTEANVRTPECYNNTAENRELFKLNKWGGVYKERFHKRSIGMVFVSKADIDQLAEPQYQNGIIERRINVKREWRIHCAPSLNLFFPLEKRKREEHFGAVVARNLATCVFRKDFEIPENWQEALDLTKSAIEAVGLDLACVDLAWSGKYFYIIEVNAASGLGEETKVWYNQRYQEIAEQKVQ